MYTKCIPHFNKRLYTFCIQILTAIVLLILYTFCIQKFVEMWDTFCIYLVYISCIHLVQFLYTNCIHAFRAGIYVSSLLPHITLPTRVSPRPKTLIDDIFSTDSDEDVTSGNILTSTSDHLAQFLLFPLSQTNRNKKKEIYKHFIKYFKADNFLNDVQNID